MLNMRRKNPFPVAIFVIVVFGFLQISSAIEVAEDGYSYVNSTELARTQERGLKWFPFLAVVSFPNTQCTGNGNAGLCYTKKQCTAKGGTDTNSPCAQGYGTCCTFAQSCTGYPGMTTVTNNLTRVSGSFSNGTQQPCQIKIPKQPGVCQLRIDFVTFNIATALSDGTCPTDTVTFSGASNLMPNGLTLCGTAMNQHLYMDYGDADTMSISANLAQSGSMYDLLITMIKCNSPERAPDGCTQYFTSPRQTVTSFNYPNQQLNSERYTVCVKSLGNSITWSACPPPAMGAMTPFFITSDPISLAGPLSGTVDCMTDWIMIPPGNIRCGTNFTDPVTSTVKPFAMYVNFDDQELPVDPALDPTTGCPLGYTCIPLDPAGVPPCGPDDTCAPPAFMAALVDDANTGFCLMYAVS